MELQVESWEPWGLRLLELEKHGVVASVVAPWFQEGGSKNPIRRSGK